MPNQKKIAELAEIENNLSQSSAVIFTNYAGLSVSQTTALRNKASQVKASFQVAKNNLLRLALKKVFSDQIPTEIDTVLNGPTAALFAKEDAVTGAKVLSDFAKDNEALQIKAGIMDGKYLTTSQIAALASLPSKNELLAKLLAQLQAPAQGLVRQLSAPAQRLVYALEAIRNK